MITLISGTSRPGSNTRKITGYYKKILDELNVPNQLLDLSEQNVLLKNESFIALESQFLFAADKFIFIIPEYNGSYPGIVKLMIDNSNVSQAWHHKKALLTGVSSGRAGNLRGMEHLTGSLLHMKMLVHPNRLPISNVDKILDEHANITDEETVNAIKKQLADFVQF